jgi:hypothetical protein
MKIRNLHYLSGIVIAIFTGFHLFNHLCSLKGTGFHQHVMNNFRVVYRNVFAESLLLVCVVIQIISGLKLIRTFKSSATGFWEKVRGWSGMYLAVFLVFHVSAVLGGRYLLKLDTDFYFGAAGLNTFPFLLFFIPYYTLAILSFFGHLASVHASKMQTEILGLAPVRQAAIIMLAGGIVTILIFAGFTDNFSGISIPETYNVMVGK